MTPHETRMANGVHRGVINVGGLTHRDDGSGHAVCGVGMLVMLLHPEELIEFGCPVCFPCNCRREGWVTDENGPGWQILHERNCRWFGAQT